MDKFREFLKERKQVHFGAEIGVHQSTISCWLRDGRVSVQWASVVSEKTGIPREELNPIFR